MDAQVCSDQNEPAPSRGFSLQNIPLDSSVFLCTPLYSLSSGKGGGGSVHNRYLHSSAILDERIPQAAPTPAGGSAPALAHESRGRSGPP